jgi:hypothetical protein
MKPDFVGLDVKELNGFREGLGVVDDLLPWIVIVFHGLEFVEVELADVVDFVLQCSE